MRVRELGLASAAIWAGLGVTQVHAQASSKPEVSEVPEVIVTAEKRADKLSKLPNAVSVFSGEKLLESGVTGVASLTQIAPSVISAASAAKWET
jgi:iron complex outermembrane receptor protein